jgi:hypothetical protein
MFLLLAVLRFGVGYVMKVYIFFLIRDDGGPEKEIEVASYGEYDRLLIEFSCLVNFQL